VELEHTALFHSHQHGNVSGVSSPVRAEGEGWRRTQRGRKSDEDPSMIRAAARGERLLHPNEST